MFTKLESLRGVAALLIILLHSPFNYGDKSISFIFHSHLIVDFFFVLSGFVMAYAYKTKIINGLTFQKYIILRLGRIYPLHFFILLAWVPYILLKQYLYTTGFSHTDQFESSNLHSFVTNLLLIQSIHTETNMGWNNPSWSISTEFFAYIFFYFFTIKFDNRNSLATPLIISISSYVLLAFLQNGNFYLTVTLDYGLLRCIGAFYIGVFLFRIYKQLPNPTSMISITILEFLSLTVSVVIIIYLNLNMFMPLLSILSFGFTIYIFTNRKNGLIGAFLNETIMRKIGKWSYSIYMIHALIIAITSNIFQYIFHFNFNIALGPLSILINTGILLFTIFISKYTYLHIEENFRDRVQRYLLNNEKKPNHINNKS